MIPISRLRLSLKMSEPTLPLLSARLALIVSFVVESVSLRFIGMEPKAIIAPWRLSYWDPVWKISSIFVVAGLVLTVLMLGDQLVHRIEHIHSKSLLHRDIQPGNLLMGTGRSGNTVYVTDFWPRYEN